MSVCSLKCWQKGGDYQQQFAIYNYSRYVHKLAASFTQLIFTTPYVKMVSSLPQEFRKFSINCCHLRRILRETQRSLDDITIAKIFPGEDIRSQVLNQSVLQKLGQIIDCHPALVVFGQSCQAKAKLVNALLKEVVLPSCGGSWRWVRIIYGRRSHVSLTLGTEFELVENLQANEQPWTTIPEEDLRKPESESHLVEPCTVLEVQICHTLLRDHVQIIVPPDCDISELSQLQEKLQKGLEDVMPMLLYAIEEETLKEQNLYELRVLKELFPQLPVFFISAADESASELTESEQHSLQENTVIPEPCIGNNEDQKSLELIYQLVSLGYLHLEEPDKRLCCAGQYSVASEFVNQISNIDRLLCFVRGSLQSELVYAANTLNEILSQCVRRFILSAFDMAREIQITPRRIQYAQEKEGELYKSLMAIANEKQEEISQLIQVTLQEMKEDLVENAAQYSYNDGEEAQSAQAVRVATAEIQHLVLGRLSYSVATQLVKSVDCLQDTFTGTLQRCLESLEKNYRDQESSSLASDAVNQILSAAYNVELTSSATSSMVHSFVERLRKLLSTFQLPWTTTPRLDAAWRKRVAMEMLDSLSATRLARSISSQFRDRVRSSHEAFLAALRSLENHYSGRLEQTEEQRVAIRKYHAPRLARLALKSTSMCDTIRYGMPQLSKEIGRGQYGVVFACDSWAGTGPCAVKTVVPPDDKHWNDLAMEFYYTRTMPEHKRIVRLRGSVVDHSYGGECTPAVLLVMDRLSRDLYCGLRSGLKWLVRLQIAIDVVEGIRFLHSQGLVHRDIKLKNVLLDQDNRAKLTDLGFCIPEAMMSGSIVGTPVHMAPELLSGHYDSSVDVYAFGILFWYICAGHVRLPYVFEQFQNKEQLWTSVKKGIRPERLAHFDEKCWTLMTQCWSGEPNKRPLLGYVMPLLQSIMAWYANCPSPSP